MIIPLRIIFTTALFSYAVKAAVTSGGRQFPKNFKFGVATAAYQVEGAWNQTGKGWSIYDVATRTTPEKFKEKSSGEVACDSFHKYKEDVGNIKQLGVDVYRFSIAWTRIMPRGLTDTINQPGVDYYHRLIDELLANGIEPMITIYHWDLPEYLQNLGGFLNENIINHFTNYADFLFNTFGYKVKYWTTFNEPPNIQDGYRSKTGVPGLDLSGTGDYVVGHNILKAHAKVYHLYKNQYAFQGGKISINLNGENCIPKTNSPEDAEACERYYAFGYDYFMHPIFSKEGDYPDILKKQVEKMSKQQGVPNRLPKFTQKEIEYIRGTADFMAVHTYTSEIVTSGRNPDDATPSFSQDRNYTTGHDSNWPSSASSWLYTVPEGIRNVTNRIMKKYNNPSVFITEFGTSDRGTLIDDARIDYFSSYFEELKKAILDDGCNVIGATVWSLMDNFEWGNGYTQKFGLIHVDFNDPERTRTWKKSAHWFKAFVKANKE